MDPTEWAGLSGKPRSRSGPSRDLDEPERWNGEVYVPKSGPFSDPLP